MSHLNLKSEIIYVHLYHYYYYYNMFINQINVLYVDDEVQNLSSFKANFRRDFNIFTADSALEAKKIVENNEIHVIVTDHMMPNISGVQLLEDLIISHPNIYRILITGCSDISIVIDAINKGQVYRFLTKPWNHEEMVSTISGAFALYKEEKDQLEINEKLMETNQQLEFMLRQKLIS